MSAPRRLPWLWALCFVGCHEVHAPGVLVHIETSAAIDSLSLSVRDIDYNTVPDVTYPLKGRDLNRDPLDVLVEPAGKIDGRFFLLVRGMRAGKAVAADSQIVAFAGGKQVPVSLRLRADFVDQDGDGFAACAVGPLCDCNDNNDHINPFTRENCDDDIDNSCSGLPVNKGCPCTGPLTCSPLPAAVAAVDAGIGACTLGQLSCTDGVLAATCNGGVPKAEVPGNYIDDDCNGSVDEGSPCLAGSARACHRGFVDDDDNPNPTQRHAASALAVGICGNGDHHPFGRQACLTQPDGSAVWDVCRGDVLPQRDVRPGRVGWAESPPDPNTPRDHGQCDGLDNDCNGVIDDAPEFDKDRDGYKIWAADPNLIDCDDMNANVHPGATEVCGNTVDEDCRCDAGGALGRPSLDGNLVNICDPEAYAYLNCMDYPRSDSHPVGSCGIIGANAQGCFQCSVTYGRGCDAASGTCSTAQTDCAACVLGSPQAQLAQARPTCGALVAGTCTRGGTNATYTPVAAGQDPNRDCRSTTFICDGSDGGTAFYCGRNANDDCMACAPAPAACAGGTLACQGHDAACGQATAQGAVAMARPLCQIFVSGCAGTTAATYQNAAAGPGPHGDCASSSCDGNGACTKALGATCSQASECGSGFCADGVCCNTACTDTCKACAVSGSVGTCTALGLGATDPGTCMGSTGCSHGPCVCSAGTGVCGNDTGKACTANGDCASNNCSITNVCQP